MHQAPVFALPVPLVSTVQPAVVQAVVARVLLVNTPPWGQAVVTSAPQDKLAGH